MTTNKPLIYKSDARRAVLKENPASAYCIDNIKPVDAVEVVHGYWVDSYGADHMGRVVEHSIDCSVCDFVFKDDRREVVKYWKAQFKICPFCGAKMDLED